MGNPFIFIVLAIIAIVAALGMLLSRNAVHSALYLVLNFVTIAVFYLVLNAPFISMVQVTVYAGAIVVLFLFVIMLLGAEKLSRSETHRWQMPLALALGLVLIIETGYVLFTQVGQFENSVILPERFGSPASIGRLLFSQYLLPFEVTSVLLLVAMIGVIVLTRQDKEKK